VPFIIYFVRLLIAWFEMQDVCGNRTEYCQTCRKYIRLRELVGHEIQCHINSNVSAETSRYRQNDRYLSLKNVVLYHP
jgi:hypothetical protein